MDYGYVRVSTASQHIDRQLDEIKKLGIKDKNIYIDYESGKDFKRKNYRRLIKKLRENDLLVIKSIDRLGRNYDMVIEEWRKITKLINANIVVIDMPLLDTRTRDNGLVGNFIADIVLQILSFVAQNEREVMKQRQAEGIRTAKARGVKFGRPRINIPKEFNKIAKRYLNHEITNNYACNYLSMTRGTFFRRLKEQRLV